MAVSQTVSGRCSAWLVVELGIQVAGGGEGERGEQEQAEAHGAGLEPTSVLTASNLDEVGVLQEKLTGGLCHGAENSPRPGV